MNELNRKNELIILAGHFCIFDADNYIEILPETVYSALNIARIILLESDAHTIIAHLRCRDRRDYSEKSVSKLIEKEREQSEKISKQLNCQLDIYKMSFTDKDSDHVASLLY